MKLFTDYLEYLKNNPQRYWFKRKLSGWLVLAVAFLSLLILGISFFVVTRNAMMPSGDTVSLRCTQENAPYMNPDLPLSQRVDDLLDRMTEWEKIGQMALIEKNSIHDLGDIARYNL